MGSQKLGQEVSVVEHQIAEQKVKRLVAVRDETAKQVTVMQNSYSNNKQESDGWSILRCKNCGRDKQDQRNGELDRLQGINPYYNAPIEFVYPSFYVQQVVAERKFVEERSAAEEHIAAAKAMSAANKKVVG